jgi:hypothetical protein
MTKVLGIANFGLLDMVMCQGSTLATDEGFTLADVLLPQGILGRIATGEEAENQRTHTGLSWPREAKIHTNMDQALRRAPLPVLWRALVERGDLFAAWKTAGGAEFSIGKMLAQSVLDIYVQAEEALASMHNGDLIDIIPSRPQAVIAIPDTLDETGQDAFLRECIGLGMPEPYLIWRPVAAALAWLKHTESELQQLIKEDENDHIHVVYFGADALEFTTLRLRRYVHNNQEYILPLRDRPIGIPQLTGMDWAGNVMESRCEADDFGAYWQLFTTFPEVWQAIAAQPFAADTLPRPWSTVKGWQFWNPDSMAEAVQSAPARSSAMLQQIIKPSCSLKPYTYEATFPEQATQDLVRLLHTFPENALRGVIVCGPLLSADTMNTWLNKVLAPLTKVGMRQYSKRAQVNAVWLSPGNAAVAEGAAIYGERSLANIPAYLDTMPQLSLFTETQGKRQWHPLLDAQEVLGGQEFEDAIKGKFMLPSGRRQLEILLCKGGVPQEGNDSLPPIPIGLSSCRARLVRHWVRTQGGSYAAVQKKYHKLENWAREYALEVAASLFSDGSAMQQADNQPDETETPFRNNIISFPSTPETNILLDVRVNMKPAAGLAKVSFTPRNKNFLDGRSIRMNYAMMRPRPSPPKTQRGWPALLEIAAHPEDPALCRDRNIRLIDEFEDTSPTDHDYMELITEVQNKCLKAAYRYDRGIMFFNALYPLTENGVCCSQKGDEQLCRISEKFSRDFSLLETKRDEKTMQALLSRVTWMYIATPLRIIDYIRAGLRNDRCSASMGNVLIESAGKCFQAENDIRLLFEHIVVRAGAGKFPIQSLRAASRVLRYREQAPSALTEESALGLAQLTLSLMEQEAQANKYAAKFFQSVLLLLYLLRFRKLNECFSPQNASAMKRFERGMLLIQKSIDYFSTQKDHAKVGKSKAALKDFEDFVHQRAIGSYPQAVLDLAGEDE